MTEAALLELARRWLAEGRAAWVVEVAEVQGSAPREAGARMLVAAGAVAGTIGGGHLELKAIDTARSALAQGARTPLRQRYALGPSLGQCCGGAVQLALAPLDADALARWPQPAARFHLQLYGAGHVGHAIVRALRDIDCRVAWIDERESQFPHDDALPPQVQRVCVEPVEADVHAAPPGAFHLVLTHSHALDLRIVEAVLRRGDFGFLGLIGSASKRARFEHRLRERGFDEAQLKLMVCPIGVEGIAGKQPGVIAAAVVAQLLQRAPEPG